MGKSWPRRAMSVASADTSPSSSRADSEGVVLVDPLERDQRRRAEVPCRVELARSAPSAPPAVDSALSAGGIALLAPPLRPVLSAGRSRSATCSLARSAPAPRCLNGRRASSLLLLDQDLLLPRLGHQHGSGGGGGGAGFSSSRLRGGGGRGGSGLAGAARRATVGLAGWGAPPDGRRRFSPSARGSASPMSTRPRKLAPSTMITRGERMSPTMRPSWVSSTDSVAVMLPTTTPVTMAFFTVDVGLHDARGLDDQRLGERQLALDAAADGQVLVARELAADEDRRADHRVVAGRAAAEFLAWPPWWLSAPSRPCRRCP